MLILLIMIKHGENKCSRITLDTYYTHDLRCTSTVPRAIKLYNQLSIIYKNQ